MVELLDAWLRAYTSSFGEVVSSEWLREEDDSTIETMLDELRKLPAPSDDAQLRLLDTALETLFLRAQAMQQRKVEPVGDRVALLLGDLYRYWGDENPVRYRLLQWLAVSRQPEHLTQLADLLVDSPLQDAVQIALVFSPLVQESRLEDLSLLFPRLLDGLGNLPSAAPILDLANYAARKRAVTTHPAAPHAQRLADLLGRLARQLEFLEEQPPDEETTGQQLSRQVADAVSLTVSLCDALALIGDRSHVGKLRQALELRHRRIQTEAAAALARLGEDVGKETLLGLVAEPVARLRVLAYAEELGIGEEIADELQSPLAQAESSLVLWLGEPTQLGIPPTTCELFDQRELFWPGYNEPIHCYLFRFTYELAGGQYSNIGIAGPLTHAFAADLQDLPPDDIYAAYAGWQAEHDEIYDYDVARLNASGQREVGRLERRMRDAGYTEIKPLLLGFFFGQKVLVASAQWSGSPGVAVADSDNIQWHSQGNARRPLGAPEALSIYKGRQLLSTFND